MRENGAMNAVAPLVAFARPQAVHPLIRIVFLIFVFTVPFDGLDVFGSNDMFTLTKAIGMFFGVVCLLQPTVCFAKPPAALWFFAIYTGVYLLQDFGRTGGRPLDLGYVLTLVQGGILTWISFNIFRHSPSVQPAYLATMVVSIAMVWVLCHFGFAGGIIGTDRVAGLGLGPNYLGFLFTVGMLSGMGIFFDKKLVYLWRMASIPFILLCAVGCVNTGSRSGMVCAAVGVLVYGLAARGLTRKLRGILLVAMLLGGFAYVVLHTEVARERWYVAIYEGNVSRHDTILSHAWDMFLEKPFFGWGPATCLQELAIREGSRSGARDTHDDVLWALLATGLLGGVLFMAGLAACAHAAWKGRNGPSGALALAIMVSFLVIGLFITTHTRKSAWLVMGYALAAPYIAGRALAESAQPTTTMKRGFP